MRFDEDSNIGRYVTIPTNHFVRVDERYSVRRDAVYNTLVIHDNKRKGFWHRGTFIREDSPQGKSLSKQ